MYQDWRFVLTRSSWKVCKIIKIHSKTLKNQSYFESIHNNLLTILRTNQVTIKYHFKNYELFVWLFWWSNKVKNYYNNELTKHNYLKRRIKFEKSTYFTLKAKQWIICFISPDICLLSVAIIFVSSLIRLLGTISS